MIEPNSGQASLLLFSCFISPDPIIKLIIFYDFFFNLIYLDSLFSSSESSIKSELAILYEKLRVLFNKFFDDSLILFLGSYYLCSFIKSYFPKGIRSDDIYIHYADFVLRNFAFLT